MNYQQTISPEELERIERYLTSSMSEQEASQFTVELETNSSLKAKTADMKLMLLAISEHSLKNSLERFHQDINPSSVAIQKSAGVFSIKRKWLIAAGILAIICSTVWLVLQRGNKYDRLYSAHYTADPGMPTYMSSSADYDFQKAMVEYKNGEIDQALKGWTSLLSIRPGNDTLRYFLGVAYQAKGDHKNAIAQFQPVVSNPGSALYKDACWYLGLSYIKINQSDSAHQYIERSGHPDAGSVLQALK